MLRQILLFCVAVGVLWSIAEAYGVPEFSDGEECTEPLGSNIHREEKMFPFTTRKTLGIKGVKDAQLNLNSFNLHLLNKANISIFKLSFQDQSLSFSETCESTSQQETMVTPLRVVDDEWTAFSLVLGKTLDASVARGQSAFTVSLTLKKPCVDVAWIRIETTANNHLRFNNCSEGQTFEALIAGKTQQGECFLMPSLVFNGILSLALIVGGIFVALRCQSVRNEPLPLEYTMGSHVSGSASQ